MVPSQSDKTSVPDVRSTPQEDSGAFSGYFFRIPDELIGRLGTLSHAELKAYLVMQHAIQKERNAGLLSTRQLLRRTGFKSMGHVERAAAKLRASGWIVVAGGRRQTARYSNPFEFRTAQPVCTPPAVQPKATRTGDCTAPAVHNCTAPAVQPIESLKKNINLARLSSMETQKQKPRPTPPEVSALETACEDIRNVYPNSELAQSGPPNSQTLRNILQGIGGRTVGEFTAHVAQRFKAGESPYDRKGPHTWGLLVSWARDFGGTSPKPVAMASTTTNCASRPTTEIPKSDHTAHCSGYELDMDDTDKTIYVRMCETCMDSGRKMNRPALIRQAVAEHPGYRPWESLLSDVYGRAVA